MRSTGIVRRLDEMGRIVLPAELRRIMGLRERENMEIFTEGGAIILTKYSPACIFCEKGTDVILFKGKFICARCLELLRAAQDAPEK